MSYGLGGINANFTVASQTSAGKGGQAATPKFAHNHTWESIDAMSKAFAQYGQEWRSVYSETFAGSGAEGDGRLTGEELNELLEKEFGGKGVRFVDGVDIENPREGRFEVYIDEANRRKMAEDPEYRAQVFSVIQIEMAGADGYSVQLAGGPRSDRTTGLSMSIAEGNPLYEGVPHSAGGTSASKGIGTFSMSSGPEKSGKSLLEKIKEDQAKKLEEKKDREKRNAAKKEQRDRLELSIEATAKRAAAAKERIEAEKENADGVDAIADKDGEGAVNILA